MVGSGPADSETLLFRKELPQADKERKGAEQNPSGCFPVSSGASQNEEVTFRVVAGSLM